MKKIRAIVAHNSEEIRNTIIKSANDLKYVEIVGTASDGIETYNKMIKLKPEIVFSQYNYDNMKGLDLIKRTKQVLQDSFPNFNTIGDIPDEELIEVASIIGNKLNASVKPPYNESVKDILEKYRENIKIRNK